MGRKQYLCEYCLKWYHDSQNVRKMHNVGKIHKEKVQIYYQNWITEKTKALAQKASNDYKKRKDKRAINIQSHFALVSLPQAFNLPPPTMAMNPIDLAKFLPPPNFPPHMLPILQMPAMPPLPPPDQMVS